MWPIETIPDEDKLFYRIHKNYIQDGQLIPGSFREKGEGMSTDWDKYSTPIDAKNRAKVPADNGIVSFISGDIRRIGLEVKHDPICSPDENIYNRAHANIIGLSKNKEKLRLDLMELYHWEIQIDNIID